MLVELSNFQSSVDFFFNILWENVANEKMFSIPLSLVALFFHISLSHLNKFKLFLVCFLVEINFDWQHIVLNDAKWSV